MSPRETFQSRQSEFKRLILSIQKRLDQVAWMRLGVFLVALGVEIASWTWGGGWWMLMLLLGMVTFGMAVRWNEAIKKELEFAEMLLKLNRDEEARLDGKLGEFDPGTEYLDAQHPYSGDLDLFGKHSLFQLLNRTTTAFGRARLVEWMLAPADRSTVLLRQEAARLLSDQLRWRQEFQAIGALTDGKASDPESLRTWLEAPSPFEGRAWLRTAPYLLIPATFIAYGLMVTGHLSAGLWWAPIVVNTLVNRVLGKRIAKAENASIRRSKLLRAWGQLIAQIEGLRDSGAAVADLQKRLQTAGKPASQEINALHKIVTNLEFRSAGVPHFVINTLFFWDIFCLKSLDRWRMRLAGKAQDWFEVIGEMEALNSLAAIRFAFPEWSNPEILDGPMCLEATEMGHPLIPAAQRVNNWIGIEGAGTVWLVTGSNMSGKSTYLRTAGTNVVLALMGAPVCAASMRLSQLQVATSMRTIDSLEENTSSFYAELKRLKGVLERVRTGPQVLFLLDEILKGTNSKDRQAGARALILQLHRQGGSGIVSTHDIELVDMADELPGAIHNYSFNCTVTPEGKLDFDYTLSEGQCLSMNATALMRAMGIEM